MKVAVFNVPPGSSAVASRLARRANVPQSCVYFSDSSTNVAWAQLPDDAFMFCTYPESLLPSNAGAWVCKEWDEWQASVLSLAPASELDKAVDFIVTRDPTRFEQAVEAARRGPKLDDPPRASERQEGGDHYKTMGVQPWDVVDTWPLEQRIGFYRGGALKYLMRMGAKDVSAQEIAKGKHYFEKLLETLE